MAEVIVSTEDLTVLGGPAAINLDLDFGKPGALGSQIYSNFGKPSEIGIPGGVAPRINDIYLNVNPDDTEYGWVYQYLNINAVEQWIQIFQFTPLNFAINVTLNFEDLDGNPFLSTGSAIGQIVLSRYISAEALALFDGIEDNINIQFSFKDDFPTAGSIAYINVVTIGEDTFLNVAFNAVQYNWITQEWAPASGPIDMQITLALAGTSLYEEPS